MISKKMSVIEMDRMRYPNGKLPLCQFLFRKCQSTKGIVKHIYKIAYKLCRQKRLLEIPYQANIGGGLYLGHIMGITINSNAYIGENCNIHKGVTIGQENRGKRQGCPRIGNRVWIGINAIIVGKIEIGDDVLIAPGSYVNCDVPSHSIVLGNPCRIIHRENATESYINNIAESK